MTLFTIPLLCRSSSGFLCETYDDGTLWRLPGHPERPEWLQWLHYAETICVHAASLTQQAIVISDPLLRSPTVQKLETKRLQKTIEVLEEQLQERDYLLSSGFSAVDISVGYSLHVGRLFTDLEMFPNVLAYYHRLANRIAFKRSLPDVHAPDRIYHQDNYWFEEYSLLRWLTYFLRMVLKVCVPTQERGNELISK